MIARSNQGISSVFVLAGIFLLGVAIGVSFDSYRSNSEFQQALSNMIQEQNKRVDRLLKTQNSMLDLFYKSETQRESAQEARDKKDCQSAESQQERIPPTDAKSDPRLSSDLIDYDKLRQLINEESSKILSAVGQKIEEAIAFEKKELDNIRLVNEESSKILSAVGQKIEEAIAFEKKELDNIRLVNEESSKILSAVGQKIEEAIAFEKKELDNIRGTLAELKEDIVRLMSNTRNPQAAQAALNLGMKALQSGYMDKAVLYLVNAVNHDPKDMTLLRNIAEFALMAAKEELIERAVSVLELATVHVEPENIEEVLNIIASLKITPNKEEELNLSKEQIIISATEILNKYDPDKMWRDAEAVAAGIEEAVICERNLKVLYSRERDENISMAREKLLSLMARLKLVQEVMPLYDYLNACIRQMKAIVDNRSLDEPLFMTLANSATGVLNHVPGVFDRLPQTMRNELELVPGVLKELEDVFLDRLSEASYSRAVESIRTSMRDFGGSYTERIKRITDSIAVAQVQLESIRSYRLARQLLEEMKKASTELRRLEVDREARYQEWAITNAHGFLKEWNKRVVTTDKFAKELSAKYEISRIDERLLIPEASRLVQHVLGVVTAELSAVDGAEIEYRMATDKKKRLEDF